MPNGRAGGKVILAGEHFVVHGCPALAVPVPALALEADIVLGPGPRPTGHVAACLALLHERWGGPPPEHLAVRIRSELPVGAGMGSSAALSVALARAFAALLGRAAGPDDLREVSLACERLAHGNPSGIDTEVALRGRPVRFVRGEPPRDLVVHPRLGLVVIDTGTAASTAAMVAEVARGREAQPAVFAERLARAREAVARAEAALAAGAVDALGRVLDQVQALLAELGVSTPALDGAAAAARAAGAAGAKLAGSGGGGVVIAAVEASDAAALAERLRAQGFRVPAAGPLAGNGPWNEVEA